MKLQIAQYLGENSKDSKIKHDQLKNQINFHKIIQLLFKKYGKKKREVKKNLD